MTETGDAELFEILRRGALEADRRELGPLSRATRLDALELDSLSFMQVLGTFEDELGARLPPGLFAAAVTLGDFCDIVRRAARAL